MIYALMGRLHAAFAGRTSGQGTVEYVGLILLMAVVLAGVVTAAEGFSDDKSIATTVVDKLKDAIGDVGESGGKK